MRGRVLVAIGDEDRRTRTVATLAEITELEVAGSVEVRADVRLAVDDLTQEIDYLLIDSHLEGSSVLALCREMTVVRPDLGIVLLQDEPTADDSLASMEAGVRGIVPTTPSVEDIHARLVAIEDWQRRVRSLGLSQTGRGDAQGRVTVITGAKGGVGVSTIAVHLALMAQRSGQGLRVCLVDLDLQQRGMRYLLDMHGRRTILDLVPVAENLTTRHIEEAIFSHYTGLKVLLAPHQPEEADDVRADAVRHVLGTLRGQFDLIVVDAGSVVTEASAVAMEIADDLVLAVTPDVPALRAAREKVDLLSRLDIAKTGDVRVLFNKTSPRSEVQPDLGRRITGCDGYKVGLPSDWKHLEEIANGASAVDLGDSPFRRALSALGRELQLGRQVVPAAGGPAGVGASEADQAIAEVTSRRKRRRRRSEAGQTTVETLVGVVAAVLIFLALLQLTMYAMATVSSRRAADAAAIVGSRSAAGDLGRQQRMEEAARSRVPGFLDVTVRTVPGDSDAATATVRVPRVVPFDEDLLTITQTGRYTD